MPEMFTHDEKDRLFDALDVIQRDVRKLREGRIRDLNRISKLEKAMQDVQGAPARLRERIILAVGALGALSGIAQALLKIPGVHFP